MECRQHARRLLLAVFITFTLGGWLGQTTLAESPRVTFDVGSMVACRDVTTPESSKSNPNERLVEAKLTISSLIQDGKSDDLLEFMIRLESPEHTAQIVDYAPKSTLSSDYAGTLTYEKKQEHSSTLGAGISADIQHVLKIGGSGENGQKESSTVRYELLPPMEQLSASGTFGRGHGVYFKLKPSRRTSLEGAKEFLVVLRVPAAWRGDYVYLRCQATGNRRGMVRQFDEEARWGSRGFIVPLYLEGDEEARQAADAFVAAEANLRSAATALLAGKSRSKMAAASDPLSALFSTAPPKPATDWLDRLAFGPLRANTGRLDPSVPAAIRSAAAEFVAAKRRLWQLSKGA